MVQTPGRVADAMTEQRAAMRRAMNPVTRYLDELYRADCVAAADELLEQALEVDDGTRAGYLRMWADRIAMGQL